MKCQRAASASAAIPKNAPSRAASSAVEPLLTELLEPLVEPGAQAKPGAQGAHVALVAAPNAALHVPAGQEMAFTVERGQWEPAGQSTGAPEEQ